MTSIPSELPPGVAGYAWGYLLGGKRMYIGGHYGTTVEVTEHAREASVFTRDEVAAAFHFAVNGLVYAELELVPVMKEPVAPARGSVEWVVETVADRFLPPGMDLVLVREMIAAGIRLFEAERGRDLRLAESNSAPAGDLDVSEWTDPVGPVAGFAGRSLERSTAR